MYQLIIDLNYENNRRLFLKIKCDNGFSKFITGICV